MKNGHIGFHSEKRAGCGIISDQAGAQLIMMIIPKGALAGLLTLTNDDQNLLVHAAHELSVGYA